ncbi:MAG: hypothetical protein RQ899_08810 [Pseudomonadales bacterium]|nr:hypothetical protein [Pseudomonadales bacterium]
MDRTAAQRGFERYKAEAFRLIQLGLPACLHGDAHGRRQQLATAILKLVHLARFFDQGRNSGAQGPDIERLLVLAKMLATYNKSTKSQKNGISENFGDFRSDGKHVAMARNLYACSEFFESPPESIIAALLAEDIVRAGTELRVLASTEGRNPEQPVLQMAQVRLLRLRALCPFAAGRQSVFLPALLDNILAVPGSDSVPRERAGLLVRGWFCLEGLSDQDDTILPGQVPFDAGSLDGCCRQQQLWQARQILLQEVHRLICKLVSLLSVKDEQEAATVFALMARLRALLAQTEQTQALIGVASCECALHERFLPDGGHRRVSRQVVLQLVRVALLLELEEGARWSTLADPAPCRDRLLAALQCRDWESELAHWWASARQDRTLARLVHQEAARYQRRMRRVLRPGRRQALSCINHDLVWLFYRLTLLCTSLDLAISARTVRIVYQVVVQHWVWQAPLSAGFAGNLETFSCMLADILVGRKHSAAAASAALLGLEIDVFAVFLDGMAAAGRRQKHLVSGLDSGAEPPLSIGELPSFLARHINVLAQPEPAWFLSRAALQMPMPGICRELRILEASAAALKVYRLEALSSALLEIYSEIQLLPQQAHFPAALLMEAHRAIAAMLDQAAAWQDVAAHQRTLNALQLWLQDRLTERSRREPLPMEHSQPLAFARLLPALRAYLRQLGTAMGRPGHLDFRYQPEAVLPSALVEPLTRATRELLRYVLVESGESLHARRVAGKTAALHLLLEFEDRDDEMVLSLVSDEWSTAPDEHRMQQGLMKRMGARLSFAIAPGQGTRYELSFRKVSAD